ncbi:MAG TPA: hypothetical protein VHZ07_09485 [Bryobacteraceae bacterium]|nr:hypothetical protein [Bryobacteraceae bacterium]
MNSKIILLIIDLLMMDIAQQNQIFVLISLIEGKVRIATWSVELLRYDVGRFSDQ